MKKSRILNEPSDYEKLGLIKDSILPWEDGRRDDGRPGAYEWWYFDSIMDDGTKLVMIFYDKYPVNTDREITPHCEIGITLPDGKTYTEHFEYTAAEASYAKEGCNVKIASHIFKGNLKEYQIKIEGINGLGADIKLTSAGSSWRPGAGNIVFGDTEEEYFTWFCAVPTGHVEGVITVDGETKEVKGLGYHDHQWGNTHTITLWNHWIWIRQNVGDYNILVFDMVASKGYGNKRYPLCFIQDKKGNIIFENMDDVKFEIIKEYLQEETGKMHPKAFKYTFENKGKKVEYAIQMNYEIECTDNYKNADDQTRKMFDQLELRPGYTRYSGDGELVITENGNTVKRNGSLIYEMIYNGVSYKEYVQ